MHINVLFIVPRDIRLYFSVQPRGRGWSMTPSCVRSFVLHTRRLVNHRAYPPFIITQYYLPTLYRFY